VEQVRYRITQNDYIAFQQLLAARAAPRFAVFMALLAAAMSAVGALAGVADIAIGAFGGAVIGAIGLPLIARWLIIPVQARKAYREYDLIKEEMVLSLNEDNFVITQTSGRVAIGWESVVLWRENDLMLTLHPTRQLAYIMPKPALGERPIAYIKERLAAHGLPRQGKQRK
jgi:hypothetical protein